MKLIRTIESHAMRKVGLHVYANSAVDLTGMTVRCHVVAVVTKLYFINSNAYLGNDA